MSITIDRILPYTTERYPYNCRVGLDKCTTSQYDQVQAWIREQKIPCSWAGWAVYMNDKNASLVALRWAS